MPRAPINIIAIPFRKAGDGNFEFALFHRADDSMWHFVSGGAEDDETAFEAAQREATKLLNWDSNRVALWELNQRLLRKQSKV